VTSVTLTASDTNSSNCEILNGGSLSVTGPALTNTSSINVDAGGMIFLSGSSLDNLPGASIVVNGSLGSVGIVTNELGGTILNSGSLNAPLGTIFNYGALTNSASGLLAGAGLIRNGASGVINNDGVLFNPTNPGGGQFYNMGILNNGPFGLMGPGLIVVNSGTINNDGSIQIVAEPSGLRNLTGGTIINNLGATLELGGPTSNAGTITNYGSIVVDRGKGSLSNDAGGLIVNTGTMSLLGRFANSAGATIENMDTIVSRTVFTNAGAVNIYPTGQFLVDGSYLQTGGVTTVDGLLSPVEGPSLIQFSGGTLGGTGTLVGPVTINGATVVPGHNAPGLLTFTDAVTISSGGVIVNIGGTARGTQYGAINAGTINLTGGVLTLNLVDLGSGVFTPHAGDKFDILKAGSISGDFFSFVLNGSLDPSLTWTHGIITIGSSMVYEVAIAPVPLPSAVFLLGSGLVGLCAIGSRRRAFPNERAGATTGVG
jgi:hypothetical protein